jgi:hypothetical protein
MNVLSILRAGTLMLWYDMLGENLTRAHWVRLPGGYVKLDGSTKGGEKDAYPVHIYIQLMVVNLPAAIEIKQTWYRRVSLLCLTTRRLILTEKTHVQSSRYGTKL